MWKKKAVLIYFFVFGFCAALNAQHGTVHTNEGVDCSECHICENPTKKDPCLKACPRPFRDQQKGRKLSSVEGPEFVVLAELEELYEPVVFSHRVHAEMVSFSGGCVSCHHFTPTNSAHPPCKECHPIGISEDQVKQPCLKGAYHRQCMSCHQKWSGSTGCEECHVMKQKKMAIGDDYVQPQYKKCNEPDRMTYKTGYEKAPVVTFFHDNHSKMYCLGCSDCHEDDPCVSCHYQNEKVLSVVSKDTDMMHYKCSACHEVDSKGQCTKCHFKEERTRFNHGTVSGWPLNIYHKRLDCHSCHPKGKRIGKLNSSCNACHSEWSFENFDHGIVGLELDEVHIEAECSDCHEDREFNRKPSCTNCHEETPETMPGKVTKKGRQ